MKKDTAPGEKIQKILPSMYTPVVDTTAITVGIIPGDMDMATIVLIGDGVIIHTGELAGAGEDIIIPGIVVIMVVIMEATTLIMVDTTEMAMLPVIIAEEEIQIIMPEDPHTIGIVPESQTEALIPDLKLAVGLPELTIEIALDDQVRCEIPEGIVP